MSSPATLAVLATLQEDEAINGQLSTLLTKASAIEARAVADALRSAYESGARDADRRAADLVARIVSRMLGIEAGVDRDEPDSPSLRREVLRRGLSALGI